MYMYLHVAPRPCICLLNHIPIMASLVRQHVDDGLMMMMGGAKRPRPRTMTAGKAQLISDDAGLACLSVIDDDAADMGVRSRAGSSFGITA